MPVPGPVKPAPHDSDDDGITIDGHVIDDADVIDEPEPRGHDHSNGGFLLLAAIVATIAIAALLLLLAVGNSTEGCEPPKVLLDGDCVTVKMEPAKTVYRPAFRVKSKLITVQPGQTITVSPLIAGGCAESWHNHDKVEMNHSGHARIYTAKSGTVGTQRFELVVWVNVYPELDFLAGCTRTRDENENAVYMAKMEAS